MGRAFSFGIESAELEVLKWIALSCMVVAHAAEYVWGVHAGWQIEVGRVAFPLFSVAVAVPLARDATLRGYKLAFTLLPYALAAQLLSQLVRESAVMNILFLYLAGAAWLAAADYGPAKRLITRALCVAVAALCEFWLPGFLFVVALVRFMESESLRDGVLVLVWLLVVAWWQGSPWALLAPVVAVVVLSHRWSIPRVPRLFPVLYVAQFAVYLIARAVR